MTYTPESRLFFPMIFRVPGLTFLKRWSGDAQGRNLVGGSAHLPGAWGLEPAKSVRFFIMTSISLRHTLYIALSTIIDAIYRGSENFLKFGKNLLDKG
jgi:hypothetical protein